MTETCSGRIGPALVDLQVNGFAGVDFNDPATPHDAIARAIRVLFSTGVARFLPTVITGPPQRMLDAIGNLARAAVELEDGEAIAGIHVEGPHISPEDGPRGAHPREWVRPPGRAEFDAWQQAARGTVRIVTVAPEAPGAARYIEHVTKAGAVAAIGHTAASAAQIREAVDAGATLSTHLGNGAHGTLPRHPNYIWDQLAEDRLMASFIADGIHLDAAFLKVAIRAKTESRSILVTDATAPACAPPGRYRVGELEVEAANGRVVLAGTARLAGSALAMNEAVANAVRLCGFRWETALQMASVNPTRAARLPHYDDKIQYGIEEAGGLRIEETWLGGRRVWSRDRT